MAGHSKWANIQHRKGRQDAKRGKIFTRLIKEITVAARMGGGDPDMNPRLRLAVDKAYENNMPKDNVERAIKRGTGDLEGVNYEEIRYEGYGIGGAAVIVDCLTDNRTRTVADVRHAFSKHGGNMGSDGSVAFLFKHCGQLVFAPGTSEEKLLDAALEAGAEDVVTNDDGSIEVIDGALRFLRGEVRAREGGLQGGDGGGDDEAHHRDGAGWRGRGAHAEARRRAGVPRRRPGGVHHRRDGRGGVGARPLRILGIDPGLRVTGFGVIGRDGQRLALRDERVHRRRAIRASWPERLRTILEGLARGDRHAPPGTGRHREGLREREPAFDACCSARRGVPRCAPRCSRTCRSPSTPPGQVKQAVVGKGNARKEQVQAMVKRLLGLSGDPSPDAADALACAICHAHGGLGLGALPTRGLRMRRGRLS